MENGEKTDKFITGEFIIEAVYGLRSGSHQFEFGKAKNWRCWCNYPTGAVPVGNAKFTRNGPARTGALPDTKRLTPLFYFPEPGHFRAIPGSCGPAMRNSSRLPSRQVFDVVAKTHAHRHRIVGLRLSGGDHRATPGPAESRETFVVSIWRRLPSACAIRLPSKRFSRFLRERHVYQNTLWSYGPLP